MAPLITTTSIIFLIQNVLTKEFLSYDGSNAAMHSNRIHQGNFHLFSTGIDTGRHVQVFADSSTKLGLSSTTITHLMDNLAPDLEMGTLDDGSGYIDDELECSVAAEVGSMQGQWYIEQESGVETNGVKLYLLAENGSKWYLRAHFQGTRVDLVCEDYVNSIRHMEEQFFSEQELKFDLVASKITDLRTTT